MLNKNLTNDYFKQISCITCKKALMRNQTIFASRLDSTIYLPTPIRCDSESRSVFTTGESHSEVHRVNCGLCLFHVEPPAKKAAALLPVSALPHYLQEDLSHLGCTGVVYIWAVRD